MTEGGPAIEYTSELMQITNPIYVHLEVNLRLYLCEYYQLETLRYHFSGATNIPSFKYQTHVELRGQL